MKREYELLERFATSQVKHPDLSSSNSKPSWLHNWSPWEIVGCIVSISLIVYGSYNLIFPPEDLQLNDHWQVDLSQKKRFAHSNSKKKKVVSFEKQGEKDESPTNVQKEKVDPKTNQAQQKGSFQKLALLDNRNSTRNEGVTQSQSREPHRQSTSTTVSSQRQDPPSVQPTRSTQRTHSQTDSQPDSQPTQHRTTRSSNTNRQFATRQPEYNPYRTNSIYRTEPYNTYTYQNTTYQNNTYQNNTSYSGIDQSNEPRLVSVQPTNVSNEPGMIEGSP